MAMIVAAALLPLVVAFLVMSFRDPIGVALPAYAIVLPFGQGIPTGLPGAFGSLSSLLGLVLGAALLVQLVTTRRTVARPPEAVPVWLAYLALAGASVTWSLSPQKSAFYFIVLASLVLLFALVAITPIERRQLVRVEDAVLLGGVASACYGLLQLLVLGGLPLGDAGEGRFGNDLLGPNNQAASLLLPLAIAVGRIVFRSRGSVLLNCAMTAMFLVSILMTGSRGGLLAVMVTLVVLIIASPRRGAMILMAAVSAAVVMVIMLVNPAGIGERHVRKGESGSGREEIWAVGTHACETFCVTGSGYGTFPLVYAQERASVPEARVLRRAAAYEAHNVWLLVAIETGVLGLILVAGALALTLRTALKLSVPLRAPPLAALSGVVFAGFFLSFIEYKFVWMTLMYVMLCRNLRPATSDDRVPAAPASTAA